MPPKKVGRKTNKKKGSKNKASSSLPSTNSTTAESTRPVDISQKIPSFERAVELAPGEYFGLIAHVSYQVNHLLNRYGDKVRAVCEVELIRLLGFTDSLNRFQQLGKLDEDDAEVNQLKLDILRVCSKVNNTIEALGLTDLEEKCKIPIEQTLAKTNHFISIGDYFTAITDTVVIVDYWEKKSPGQMRETSVHSRVKLEVLKGKLERLQESGNFEDDIDAEVKELKMGIRFFYESIKSMGSKLVGC